MHTFGLLTDSKFLDRKAITVQLSTSNQENSETNSNSKEIETEEIKNCTQVKF